jgi:pentachlorophenol monooxygenase/3-(3-hydroxy-phenyl)propionate hydroxylase
MNPVVVIGNGPVGQTAALLLARWNVPTVVLDQRAARDRVGSKAICQHRDVLDVWAAVGAGEQIAAEGVTWTTARTYYRGEELFSLTLPDPGHSPFPPFVNISQSRTEELLDEQVATQSLIDVRWNHEVTALEQDADGVTARCGDREVRGSHAIVSAGARCDAIRDALGLSFAGQSFDDRFLICDIRADLAGWATERRFHFDPEWNPGRQVLIHPCPDSTYRIDWQVPPEFDLESDDLDARIRAIIGERPYEIVWRSVYRFHSRCVDRMRVGRVLLAGDTAHLMAPFGARGLNSGVADAENAAWKITYVRRGWAPESLLESYHAERHAAALENLAVTSATMDFLVPPDAARAARRADVLARAAHDPAARAHVNSGRLSEPFWYVDSPLTTPDPTRPFAGRPPRGTAPPAAPGIIAPDAPITPPPGFRKATFTPAEGMNVAFLNREPRRLREIARDGFLVLAGAGVRPESVTVPDGVGPVRVLALPEIDPSGELTTALGARPGEVWVIRPDAHIAAVVTSDAVAAALDRALGLSTADREEDHDGLLPQLG